ncbi:MAG TPA: NfeD family protein [Brevundimonas sp.]|jgi:membrane protein implicated in regulation of membrane protease activity|uniref:NfeD family protein n=1 Tax=Brevundimonas sp. TaxID=1871086 RepID=UPI002DE9A272|nr:NfeD family protein [Brevundimonas sp.]
MDAILSLHASQPWWIWLAIGVALLAVEAAISSEWLLWPAVAAGVVAVLTALGLRLGLTAEVAIFALLTAAMTLLSRRLIQRVNPNDAADVNDRSSRLVGQQARVVEPFVAGRGRVFVSGAEWAAEINAGEAPVGTYVTVVDASGATLKVTTG